MNKENNTNRDVTVAVGPNLGSVGGQGGENGAPPAEGLGTIGGGAVVAPMTEPLQSTEGGIVISSTKVQQFVEEFRDLISIAGDDVLSNIEPFLLSISVVRLREWLQKFPEMARVHIGGKTAAEKLSRY